MELKNYKIIAISFATLGLLGLIFIIKFCIIRDQQFLINNNLQTVVQYSPVRFMPNLKDEVKELIDIVDNLEKNRNSSGVIVIKKPILNDLKFDGCWSAKIKNRGNLACIGVHLVLPRSEIFMIKRENSEIVIDNSKRKVLIGNIIPLEEVMVYGWTYGYEGPRFKDKSAIKLTYEKGIGKVVLKLPLQHYWYYTSKLWPVLLLLWSIALCALMFILFIIFIEHNNSDDPTGFRRHRPKLM